VHLQVHLMVFFILDEAVGFINPTAGLFACGLSVETESLDWPKRKAEIVLDIAICEVEADGA
jgi:hypothetical protein